MIFLCGREVLILWMSELKQFALTFLKNYKVIVRKNEESIRNIMGISSTDVRRFLDEFMDFANFISQLGGMIHSLLNSLVSDIENASYDEKDCSPLEYSRGQIIDFIGKQEIKQWLIEEKQYGINTSDETHFSLGKSLKSVMEAIDQAQESENPRVEPCLNPLRSALQYFSDLKDFKAQVKGIQDHNMSRILKKQEDMVRADIKGLIERQLKVLDTDPRWEELSLRRKAALGIEE